MCRLLIVVPRARRTCGRATLVARDGSPLLPPLRILATASAAVAKKHGNPSRDRTLPFGHPPQGTYVFAGAVPPGFWPKPKRARRFGKSGAMLLLAIDGEAKEAAAKGRRTFYLHGGPSDRIGRLRPTRGGFRMLDADLTALLAAINAAHARGDALEAIEVVDIRLPARAVPRERVLNRRRRDARRKRRQERDQRRSLEGSAPPQPLLNIPLAAPAIALAAKLLGDRSPDVARAVSRRDLVALALLITTVSGCCEDERPSRCEPVACDPNEGYCPPPEQRPTRCTSSPSSDGWSYWGDTTSDESGGGG